MIVQTSTGSVIDCPRQYGRSLWCVLVFGMYLSACTTLDARATDEGTELLPATSAEINFDQYEVFTSATIRQTVLPGFFLGDAIAELVVIQVDENGDRRLQMYAFDGDAWVSVLDATLSPAVLFVDVANGDGLDRLITYERGRLNWFDPDSATERPLVEVAMDYNSAHDLDGSPTRPGGEPPHVDITRDLNHDRRDDLVLPDASGFWISIQMTDGSFTDAVKLGPTEPFLDELIGNLDPGGGASDDSRTYRDVGITAATLPWYLSRVHEMDYDHDGRSDLVFWNEEHFEVHRQDARGLFSTVPETFTTDVSFNSEGAYSHAFEFSDHGVFSFLFGFGKKTSRTVLHSLRDLNGDLVADLVTLTLSGRSFAKQRSVYEVHFGTSTADGTVFARDVGTAIHPRGKAGVMQPFGYSSQRFQDFDGDGQVDIMFRDVDVGIGGMTRALVGNSVPINLEFYRSEAGAYTDKPTGTRRIRRFAPLAGLGNVFFPAVLIGDVNGDGRADLLVGQNPNELHVFLGVPGQYLFAQEPRKVAVAMPADERNIRLVDINKDSKQDILVHHRPANETHRVTVLISR